MKIIAGIPVRNESWCLGLSARVALKWNDEIVIGLHACTDDSVRIAETVLAEHPGRVRLLHHPETTWDEMSHRQRLLEECRKRSATYISIVDADEVMVATTVPVIRQYIERMNPGLILRVPGYNLRGGIHQYHANGVWGHRSFSLAFADDPRLSWSGDKFHSREPGGMPLHPYSPIAHGTGGVVHLWGASERRLRAKAAWYKCQEVIRWPDKPVAEIDRMYSWSIHGDPPHQPQHVPFGTPATWTYAPVPAEWWDGYEDLMQYLDVDAEPYQEKLIREAVATHGHEAFYGLDLFGTDI